MKHLRPSLVLFSLIVLSGCASPGVSESDFSCPPIAESSEVHPWTDLDFRNDPDEFQFAIVSDRTGKTRPGIFAYAVDRLNLLQPEFVMCVGDLIMGKTEDLDEIKLQRDELTALVERLDMPFFYVPGNHDITNPTMSEEWYQRFGRTYYHFLYKDALFLCLNSEDGKLEHITEKQVDYARKALGENPDVRWTFVFLHKPLWNRPGDNNWDKIEPLLDGRDYTVFAGHTHTYEHERREGHDYITLAKTGCGGLLRGIEYGEFDHIMWVTMTKTEPKIATIMLDGIWDKNTLTTERQTLLPPLKRGEYFRLDPIWAQTDPFESGETKLTVTNPSKYPLALQMNLSDEAVLKLVPKEMKITLPPGKTETFPIKFTAAESLDLMDVPNVFLSWKGAFKFGGTRELKGEGRLPVFLDKVFDVPVRQRPVSVDGNLGEWSELPLIGEHPVEVALEPREWKGARDSSFRFAVERDDENLYVAVSVEDDSLTLFADRPPWEQDGVEIRIDARPDPARSEGVGENEMEDFLLLAMSPGSDSNAMVVGFKKRIPEGVKMACMLADSGYNAEVSIPVAYLDGMQGKPWNEVRINVSVDDFDKGAAAGSQICWRPDWRRDRNYLGSGTFRK